jgi:hypothetical protein
MTALGTARFVHGCHAEPTEGHVGAQECAARGDRPCRGNGRAAAQPPKPWSSGHGCRSRRGTVPNTKTLVQGVSHHSPPGPAGVPSGRTGPDGRREEARLATTLWSVGLAVILLVAGTLALAHKGASTQRFPGVSGEIPQETQPPRPSRSRTKNVYGNPSKASIAKISGVDRATLVSFHPVAWSWVDSRLHQYQW